jgi:iron uptake system component EfeO
MDAPYVGLAAHTRIAAALVTGLSLPALFGCTADTRDADGSADARVITVTSTDDSCDLSADTAPAGELVYKVTNAGSTVTAFYLYDPDRLRIVGSVEDVAPGLSRDLVIKLAAGTYVRTCEAGTVANGTSGEFTVTASDDQGGSASVVSEKQVDTATAQYKAYVEDQATQLLARTQDFMSAYVAGDDDEARRLYSAARVHLKRIEPVVESFAGLDQRMDARARDLDRGDRWTGWHRIEEELWRPPSEQSTETPRMAQRARLAQQLLHDTRTLHARVRKLAFTTNQIAEGVEDTFEKVAIDTVTGKEEVWSHSDLYDLQANIDGARAAFEALRPVLAVKAPVLEKQIARRFTEMEGRLRTYRVGVDGFAGYDTLTVTQARRLSDAVNALAEPLSMLTAAVAM